MAVRCQALGCNADLSTEKPYCRKKCLCQAHLVADSFMIKACDSSAASERARFCFQCGKAERLTKFTGNQRSCDAGLRRRRMRQRTINHPSRPGSSGSSSIPRTAAGKSGRGSAASRVARRLRSASPGSSQDASTGASYHQQQQERGAHAALVASVVASLLGTPSLLPDEPALSCCTGPLPLGTGLGLVSPVIITTQQPFALQRQSSSSSSKAAPSSPSQASHISSDTHALPTYSPQLIKMQICAWQELGMASARGWQLAQPPQDDALQQLCLELPEAPPLDLTGLDGAFPGVPETGGMCALLLDALLADMEDDACGPPGLGLQSCLNGTALRC